MRLSKDKDSWKASGVIRRDFRSEHGGPEVPPHRRKRTKDSKRFCRGKPGRQHIPVRIPGRWYDHDACRLCGKKLAWYWKRNW